MNKLDIKDYFERIAPGWEHWHTKNHYYHGMVFHLIQGMVPPGSRVLELGSGTGDVLAGLKPSRGIGLNVAKKLTELALRKFPHLEFFTVDVDQAISPEQFRPEYIVLASMLDHVYDVWDVLENLKPLMSDRTLLVMTTNNPLWAPILRLGSKIGLRSHDSPRNFITNRDLGSIMASQGFDVVEEGLAIPVPKKVPFIGCVLNALLPELPGLRWTSSIQYLASRLPLLGHRFPVL